MNFSVEDRVLREAEYIVENRATVRMAAKVFGVGKSTVHLDVTKRLQFIDEGYYQKVKEILFVNLSQRHVRGGMATRNKYKNK